jgi:hypothetical protein
MKDILTEIFKAFDNREIAISIWLLIGIIFCLTKSSCRKVLFNFLKILTDIKIVSIIFLAWAYSLLIIYILYSFAFWNFSMTKDSILWFLLSGLIILINVNKTDQNKDYFLDILKDNIKATILLEFVANIYNFSLLGEIFFIPFIVLISIIMGITSTNEKYKIVENFFTTIISLIGFILLILSVIQIITSIQEYLNFHMLKLFLLPIILSIAFIPFAYLFAVFMNYEILFARFKFFLKDHKLLRYARLKSIQKCGLRLNKLRTIAPVIMKEFYSGINKDEIRNIIK